MGQAWCKERTSKAQDSKSPLDRVFVRCAHRIYPSLKEEGSVLGGATQRVTSSEIGYAGSPPREVLTRGRSIDSVDRPFHPSDWVDVNLEVPSTPRPSSVLTNLTVDTNLYPTTTPTSSCSNLKDATPIPPPRRRKRNKGRPLPPKPDEIATENLSNGLKRPNAGEEPLYSSVRSPKSSGDEQDTEEEARPEKHRSQDDGARDGRRTKEIYEHKVNGTGRIISSDVVSGKRTFESIQQRRAHENEEYEKFARSRTSKDSSTPNREGKKRSREIEKQIKDSSRGPVKSSGNARTKNYSTVSLPNYDELDAARHRSKEDGDDDDDEHQQDKARKSRRPVRSSTGSLPAESFLSPFSEKTSVRLEDYIPRSDNLSPYQVLEKLDCGANGMVGDDFVKYDPSKSEDWELGDIGNCELNHQRRLSFEDTSKINNEGHVRDSEDVVDFSTSREDGKSSSDRDASRSPIYLLKPESFGKTPSPVLGEPEHNEVDPNRTHVRYFDPPTSDKSCRISCAEESKGSKEPFFLDEAKHRSALDTIRGPSTVQPEPDRSAQSRMMFTRSLSNESEPNDDTYEAKELDNRSTGLIRTISEESLPREMLEEQELDDFFDEKLAKDVHNKLKKSLDEWKTSTPPSSPELKIRPQIQDSDHSTLLKVLKEEAAEESNLSSMTPSLTELEAALSDMLEKEESQDVSKDDCKASDTNEQVTKKIEHGILVNSDSFDSSTKTGGHRNLVEKELKDRNEAPVPLTRFLDDKKSLAERKVSFCMWEETVAEVEEQRDEKCAENSADLNEVAVLHRNENRGAGNAVFPVELPPEKPSRLNRSMDDLAMNLEEIPTPPRRKNRSLGVTSNRKEFEVVQNGSAVAELVSSDRLI